MKIIDAHTHIDYILHKHQDDVIESICCATNESQWIDLVNIIRNDKVVYGAFGIHPWYVDSVKPEFDERLEDLLLNNDSYMVGEIGLDKYKPYLDKQINVFEKQLKVAVKLHRVVVLHCVGAWDKVLNILKQYKKSDLPMLVVHDFHGSTEILEFLLNNYNVMFSFNNINKPEYIKQIPDDKIMVESDGKKDVILFEIIKKIENIKHNENIGDIIYNNTQRILKNG